ncbi:glycogen debranching protein GlgX [Silanimonas sp.]|jgi:glycogen operon protein|uniref:glycogen debranching protein GlgX n=1 Tax=Silanimonas sp. TaxID=1929290 RepID=UPI0037CB1C03
MSTNAAVIAAPRHTLVPGPHAPLGAHVRDGGVDVAVASQRAKRIELCVFSDDGTRELERLPLHSGEDGVFHGRLEGAGPGLVYGFRAHGRYQPESGYRFNPAKLLLDPYARELVGDFQWRPEHHGWAASHPQGRQPDTRDNAALALKARVVDAPSAIADGLAVRATSRPRRPLRDSVLYELNVRGFTMQLPGVPEALRGTFEGLAHPAAIAHLKSLGVTTLSLMPVMEWLDEAPLVERGLRNYWGYNTLAFFCPARRLCRHPQDGINEFRRMVATLQREGFDVVLDVVLNHTAEGDKHGATLSFRGLDNASWYRLIGDDRSRYENVSGCGNTLRLIHPRTTQFALDVLRYWVETMGVDGFRFDLGAALGRTRHGFDPSAPFFVALRQDPTLAQVHLIAEPWDAGFEGYQLGRFPGRFAEWNDRFRDAVRGYWLGAAATADGHPRAPVPRSEFAKRFTASSDLFQHGQRRPQASINYVSAHDGRTLADVVGYARRHNDANGEHNRDGHAHEVCTNFGVEGATDEAAVLERRRRVRRALLATTLLAQGTPMLLAGDEVANSQAGNNNAYCQDNPTGWIDWAGLGTDDDARALVAALVALRASEAYLRWPTWFLPEPGDDDPTIRWLRPDGSDMRVDDWHDANDGAFACQLRAAGSSAPRGCIAFNPGGSDRPFELPDGPWHVLLETSGTFPDQALTTTLASPAVLVPAHSLLVLRRLTSAPEPT